MTRELVFPLFIFSSAMKGLEAPDKFKNVILEDFSVGSSLASLLRMMIQIRQDWLVSVGCVRGRLCEAPDDWGRNLFQTPPSAAELEDASRSEFETGKPFSFSFDDSGLFLWPSLFQP